MIDAVSCAEFRVVLRQGLEAQRTLSPVLQTLTTVDDIHAALPMNKGLGCRVYGLGF